MSHQLMSTSCSCRGPGSLSQHQHGGVQLSATHCMRYDAFSWPQQAPDTHTYSIAKVLNHIEENKIKEMAEEDLKEISGEEEG